MNLLRSLIREALLLEDKRGSIVRRLGLPKRFADYLHNFHAPQSHKYSYWMAEQFLRIVRSDTDMQGWIERERKKEYTYAEEGLYSHDPSKQSDFNTSPIKQGDIVSALPAVDNPRVGKYVGHTPGDSVWVAWDEEDYEGMVRSFKEKWENWEFGQYKKLFGRGAGLVPVWAFDRFFSLIFKWHEATGGGADLSKMTIEKAAEKAKAYEMVKKSEAEGKIMLTFDDGYYWVDLQKEYCEYEAKEMGHCANDETGFLWSLRDKFGKPHVTATIQNGKLSQMKGKENAKPIRKYHKYIAKLLASECVTTVTTGDDDFQLSDLSDNAMKWLIQQKPSWKYIANPQEAIFEYAEGKIEWEEFKKVTKYFNTDRDIYRKDGIMWKTDVEDMATLFVSDEDTELAHKDMRGRKKTKIRKRVEAVQALFTVVFMQSFRPMFEHLGIKKRSERNLALRNLPADGKHEILVEAANKYVIALLKKHLKLKKLKVGNGSANLEGHMSYEDFAKMIHKIPERDDYSVGAVIFSYIQANNLHVDLSANQIYAVFEKVGLEIPEDL